MKMLCIVGPTATGKTRLSVALAQRLGAEIVSCDSMQLYRGMDVGTAKPTAQEMGGVPHHMISCVDPREEFSVSRYVELADRCVQDIFARGKPVIVVGGTGLYVDSLVAGREFAPFPQTGRRGELAARAEKEGIEPLMEQLRAVDPEAAESIHPSNQKRVIRALEVYLETGKTITQHNRETRSRPPKYRPVWIGLDYVNRSALYARIDARVDEMFAQGLAAAGRRRAGTRDEYAGHRLQGADRVSARRGHRGRCAGADQAGLAALRQAAADVVPPQPGRALDRPAGYARFRGGFGGSDAMDKRDEGRSVKDEELRAKSE